MDNKYWDIIKISKKIRKKYSKGDNENNRNYLMSLVAVCFIDNYYNMITSERNEISFYIDVYKTKIKKWMRDMKERGKIRIEFGPENYIWI